MDGVKPVRRIVTIDNERGASEAIADGPAILEYIRSLREVRPVVEDKSRAMRLHHRHPRLPVMIGDRSQLFDRSNLVPSILDPRRMEAPG